MTNTLSGAVNIRFHGADFVLSADDIDEHLREDLMDCGVSGQDATEAVEYVMAHYDITGDEADCRAYLAGYGAWEAAELTDHAQNLRRLVWLTGCSLSEQGEAHFSTY